MLQRQPEATIACVSRLPLAGDKKRRKPIICHQKMIEILSVPGFYWFSIKTLLVWYCKFKSKDYMLIHVLNNNVEN